jgi:hypothetical protein
MINNIILNVHSYRNILLGKTDDLCLLRWDHVLTKCPMGSKMQKVENH